MQQDQMENRQVQSLPSETQGHSGSRTSRLIKEWLFRFGVNFEKDVAPVLPLWLEAFGGMKAETLEPLFRRALKTCKFFPRVAEILAPIETSEKSALPAAAEQEWERVLDLRRLYWNPDMPGGFSRGMPKLSERVQQACRASGVFKDYESADQLHVWAHKRFIESFTAWGELEQAKHLLPEGEVKNLLTQAAQAKALPASAGYDGGNARPNYLDEPVIPANERWGPEEKSASLKLRQELPKKFPAWDSKEQRKNVEAELAEYGNRVKTIAQEKGVTLP